MNRFVLLGDANVGKTCILQRFTKSTFNNNESPTVGAAFANATIDYHNEKVEVNIWDTAGQERFESIAPIYSRGAIGAMIVFDLTNYPSFQHLSKWLGLLENRDSVYVVICGNKADLAQDDEQPENSGMVTRVEAENFCKQNDALYFETSAKTGEMVNDAFNFLFIGALDKQDVTQHRVADPKADKRSKNRKNSNSDGNVIDLSNNNEKEEGGCC